MEELKKCPFFGGEAIIKQCFEEYFVQCGRCNAIIQTYVQKEEAIKAWNRRME